MLTVLWREQARNQAISGQAFQHREHLASQIAPGGSASKLARAMSMPSLVGMSIEDGCKAIAPKINTVIDACRADPQKKSWQVSKDTIKAMMLDSKCGAYMAWLECDEVATHPSNRYGDMVEPVDAHKLLCHFARHGHAESELKEPTASEMPPTGPRRTQFIDKNVDLVSRSDGLLPMFPDPSRIRAVSAACSHTVAAHRVAKHGALACEHTKPFANVDGHVSKERLFEAQPTLAKAIDGGGMQWFVVRYQLEDLCPGLMEFLSEAANLYHLVANEQSKMQLLLQIHQKVVKNCKGTDLVGSVEHEKL